MTVIVFDVPAVSGGALSILNSFHRECSLNKNNSYIFVVSQPELDDTGNIMVLRYPWIKRSWLHRLYFDYVIARQLVKRHLPDEILSLQNVTIPRVKTKQILYVHNSLPFADKRYKLTENPQMWVYQNIIGYRIKESIRKADNVIVQTNWMKQMIISMVGIDPDRIVVVTPKMDFEVKHRCELSNITACMFFYPASGFVFKNHKIIIEAAVLLKKRGIVNYKVIFTLTGNENKYIASLYNKVKENDLPIEFIGSISREAVFDYYCRSVLLFPSYIETFGMPLLEAKLHNTPIIASDCPFSHEILDDYEKTVYIDPFDCYSLSKVLDSFILAS